MSNKKPDTPETTTASKEAEAEAKQPAGTRSAADQLADSRRENDSLRAELEKTRKRADAAEKRAVQAEAEAKSMTDDLRKATMGAVAELGSNSAQLNESYTMSSGIKDTGPIHPQRGDIICAGTDADVAALQKKLGKRAKVFRVSSDVLKQCRQDHMVEE